MDPRLFPYQREAVRFIDRLNGRAILGDDMGLGKTVEALCWAADKVERALIVCPANVVYKWRNEVQTWTGWRVGIIEGFTKRRPPTPVQICSYAVMTRRYRELREAEWDLVIWDECHYLKGSPKKVKRVAAAKTIRAPFMLALSGTPFLNRPIELFNTLDMIQPGRWNLWEYGNRYCGGMEHPDGPFRGATRTKGLQNLLKRVMIRRLKSDLRDQLPALMPPVLLPVDIDGREYREALKQINRTNALTTINSLYHIIGREKAKAVVDWVHDFFASVDDSHKIVVAAHHIDVISYLRKELMEYGTTFITGEVTQSQREHRIAAFQSAPRPRVIIINRAGGEGIDLFGKDGITCADLVFVERQWTPALELQLIGRLDRTGQQSPVTAYYLVANGTYDETMAKLVADKWEVMDRILGMEDMKEAVVRTLI